MPRRLLPALTGALVLAGVLAGAPTADAATTALSVRGVTTTVTAACASYRVPLTVRAARGERWQLQLQGWGDAGDMVPEPHGALSGSGPRRTHVAVYVCSDAGQTVTGAYSLQSVLTLFGKPVTTDGLGTDGAGHPQYVAVSTLRLRAAPTTVTSTASTTRTKAGVPFLFSGRAERFRYDHTHRAPVVGEPIGIEFQPTGSSAWTTIGVVRTDASGAWAARVYLHQSGRLRGRLAASEVHATHVTPARRVTVHP